MRTLAAGTVAVVALAASIQSLAGAEGARLRHLASIYADEKGAGFHLPEGVGCGRSGAMVVADTANGRLLRFTFKDKLVEGGSEIKVAELQAPVRVAIGSTGDIYALDGRQRRIVRFDASGALKGVLSLTDVPAPTTVVIKSFALDASDTVHILDTFSGRVLVVSPDGKHQRSLALPADAGFVTDVSVDALGNVVVLDATKRRLYVARKDGSAFEPLGGRLDGSLVTMPTALATGGGLIFVVEGAAATVTTFGQDGTFLSRQLTPGWKDGSMNHPAQICVGSGDEIFIADRDNSRVQVFALVR